MRRALRVAAVLVLFAQPVWAEPPDTCSAQPTDDPRTTDGDDFLTGSDGADIVALGDGDDQYFAAAGPDVICGGNGADLIGGEEGNDELSGGNGDDILLGLRGNDVLGGGDGDDDLRGSWANDVLRGGQGADVLSGSVGDDLIRAAGDDTRDEIHDGTGSDEIIGDDPDIWFRCDDGEPDPHPDFTGTIVPDPDCSV
jgi:Ca2+-binding RTX toxin-like protein